MKRKPTIIIASDGVDGQVNLADGTPIPEVTEITIWLEAGQAVRADITLCTPAINVTATLDEVTFLCPACEGYVSHECEKEE